MSAALFIPATWVDQVRDKNRVREVELKTSFLFSSITMHGFHFQEYLSSHFIAQKRNYLSFTLRALAVNKPLEYPLQPSTEPKSVLNYRVT